MKYVVISKVYDSLLENNVARILGEFNRLNEAEMFKTQYEKIFYSQANIITIVPKSNCIELKELVQNVIQGSKAFVDTSFIILSNGEYVTSIQMNVVGNKDIILQLEHLGYWVNSIFKDGRKIGGLEV